MIEIYINMIGFDYDEVVFFMVRSGVVKFVKGGFYYIEQGGFIFGYFVINFVM